jgi:signal transduction histidine kinase
MILDVCADELAALGSDPDIRFEGPVDSVDDAHAEHLLAVLREALSNVARHAHATHTRVSITVDDHLTLLIEDHGRGFTGGRAGGNGLDNVAARAAELAGSFDVSPATAGGTRLEWRVPL